MSRLRQAQDGPYGLAVIERSVRIAFGVTTFPGAMTLAVNLGAVLPQLAAPGLQRWQAIGVDFEIVDDFTDGAAGTFTMDVGDTNDVDILYDGASVDGNVAGRIDAGAVGILPSATFPEGGQLVATLDGSVNLDTITAGDLTVRVRLMHLPALPD